MDAPYPLLRTGRDAAATAREIFLAVAVAAWSVPVLIGLARRVWTTEQGGYGPIILCTGLWLLAFEYRAAAAVAAPGSFPKALAALCLAGIVYLPARIVGALPLEFLAASGGLLALLYARAGAAMLRRLWFPLGYLLFLMPPPFFLIGPATRALKLWIASGSVDILSLLGFEVAESGTALFVDQYELLVEAACSGMNSLVGLLAIGLLYVYLRHRSDWRYAAVLALLIVPLAIGTNLIRVIALLLLVHQAGAAVLETPLHLATGLAMVGVAMILLVVVDEALAPLRRRLSPAGPGR